MLKNSTRRKVLANKSFFTIVNAMKYTNQIAITFLTALFLNSFYSAKAAANELILPLEVFQSKGYVPVPQPTAKRDMQKNKTEMPTQMPWPVVFADAVHTVAQGYVDFQDYGDEYPYFHGGCDLRSAANSDVVATVTGTLEGGFYGYTNNADGSMVKQWQAWNGSPRRDAYFELAIVTDDGYRFEYHHVDSEKLPASTVQALNKGHVRIQAGTVIGKVNGWAFSFQNYSHIHYNIVRPDGMRVNPEYYSVATADHTAPVIQAVYGLDSRGQAIEIHEGDNIPGTITEIVVATTDKHDKDAYMQTPTFASIEFDGGHNFSWDFRQFLTTADGQFPPIWSVFKKELRLSNGIRKITSGQYGKGLFLMRLPVLATDHGGFTITIGDTAGNKSTVRGNLSAVLP